MYVNSKINLFISLITITSTSIVKWVPNGSFNLAINFKDDKLPCSKQTVVFPEIMTGSVKLESVIRVSGIVLPAEGELILDGSVDLGADTTDFNCTEGNTYYLDKSTSSWNQAGAWSSPRFNEATPDAEKMPCYNDVVEFPDAKYTVQLPDSTQYVRGLKIGNKTYTIQEFKQRAISQEDEQQTFVLNENLGTGVSIVTPDCPKKYGCPCQHIPLHIDCSLMYCHQPSCVAPIKPTGYCCKFCGGYVTFEIDDDFDMVAFKELVAQTVNSYGHDVIYHIGFTPVTLSNKLQLVIVDKGEYTGISAEVTNSISNAIQRHWFRGEKLAQISGSPLYKSGLGGKIFVSMFFAVLLVMGSIYLYYYRLPKMQFPILNRGTVGFFSRFERRSDSVVSLTRRDSTIMESSRTAFRNPMYNSKRGRVEVAESVVEE